MALIMIFFHGFRKKLAGTIYILINYCTGKEDANKNMLKDVGMAVPKTTETRCRDGSVQA